MIAFLKGTVEYIQSNYIVIEVNGIGYQVFVAASVFDSISGTGDIIKVYTYMNVKEDDVTLFGFSTRDELEIFKLLITVNGIGPKGAIAILSTLSVDELKFAVLSDNAKAISKSPGIGAKTASKLILELKDKFSLEETFESSLGSNFDNMSGKKDNSVVNDAILALTALGYSNSEAMSAIKKVNITDIMTTEDIIKKALLNF